VKHPPVMQAPRMRSEEMSATKIQKFRLRELLGGS